MNDAPRPAMQVGTIHYQILCGAGLVLVFFAQFDQGVFLGNLLVGCIGLLGIVSTIRIAPLLLLIVFAGAQLHFHWEMYRSFQVDERRPLLNVRDLVLALGLVTYVAANCRLQSLSTRIFPADPRQREEKQRRRGRWRWRELVAAQQKRARRLLTPQEIARFVLILPLGALAAQALWFVIGRPWILTVFHERVHRLISLAWLLIMGALITGMILAQWRRRHMDQTAAAVYLQDTLWRETRREQRRTFRWLAWRRLHERTQEQKQ